MDQTCSRSDLDKEDNEDEKEDCVAYRSQKRPMSSPPTTARTMSESGETVVKKRAESADVGWRPGQTKARPIPEMKVIEHDPVPRDPDKDSPDVVVSIEKLLKLTQCILILSHIDIPRIILELALT